MEIARLKQMYADLSLENRILKDGTEKILKPAEKREVVLFVHKACAALRIYMEP